MRIHGTFSILVAFVTAGSSCSSDPDPAPTTATQMIGPAGGTISVGDAKVIFPAGALVLPRDITVSRGKANPPAGYVALSPVIQCEPSGIDFAHPVAVTIPFVDDGKGPATIFWSSSAQPTFKDVGGAAQGASMTTNVDHFSSGFVGRRL